LVLLQESNNVSHEYLRLTNTHHVRAVFNCKVSSYINLRP
jgi:hypothetical protein